MRDSLYFAQKKGGFVLGKVWPFGEQGENMLKIYMNTPKAMEHLHISVHVSLSKMHIKHLWAHSPTHPSKVLYTFTLNYHGQNIGADPPINVLQRLQ